MRRFGGHHFLATLQFATAVPFVGAAFHPVSSLLHFSRSVASFSTTKISMSSNINSPGLVVVVGSANQDLTTYTTRFPVKGETVLGTSFEQSCGGKGANQAVAAAGLGIAPVSMVCRVGADTFGEAILSNFRKSPNSKHD